ncbi:MAG: Wzz/FepE/Etk N-terminal domain-containing protein, partial [Candidatus Latescibacteria bacterium]|nr:Wzz/FepE/Etk N-terminal domain-containing protein [Candidatus Latescibacterota bacterium]
MGEYEREIELYDYIEVLLKYKWLILIATLACGSLGWLLKPTAPPPLYEADIVLMVKELSSQQEGTDQAVAGQSSGFYETLARDDGLKQAVLDSIGPLLARLNINLTLTAMDGLLSVAVLDPGIKLTVHHSHPDLPIPLVSAWANLFVARNSDLNSEEGGRYYDYVEQQYRTVNDRLKA